MLAIPEILRPFVNRLTPDDNYLLCNNENLQQPIQMKLTKKRNIFSEFVTTFLIFTFNSEHFEKIDECHSLCLSKMIDWEMRTYVNV